MRRECVAVMMAVALLAGCNARVQDQTQTSAPPTATIATQSDARIALPDGFMVRVEIAADDPTREQGLMYRDRLADDAGMIFFFPTTGQYSFWMKNTLIPLDIIWLDDARRIVHIGANTPPCHADPCPNYDPGAQARYVLELAGGMAAKHKLAVGSLLRFEGMDRVVVR